jgi:hypothetical protein
LPKALTDCLQTGMFGSGASERLNVLDQTFRSAICSRQNYQIRCGSTVSDQKPCRFTVCKKLPTDQRIFSPSSGHITCPRTRLTCSLHQPSWPLGGVFS